MKSYERNHSAVNGTAIKTAKPFFHEGFEAETENIYVRFEEQLDGYF